MESGLLHAIFHYLLDILDRHMVFKNINNESTLTETTLRMVNFDRMIKRRNFVLASPDLYVNDLKNKIVSVLL